MIPSPCLRLAAALATVTLATASAAAAPKDDKNGDAYLTVTFMGSLIEPVGAMANGYDGALASALRIGWTGSSGLGVGFDAFYTPIPHETPPDEQIEAHFFHTTAALSYAYRSGVWRLWSAAGGAGVLERINTEAGADGTTTTEHRWTAGAYGAAGVDFLLFANGGPSLAASYTHAVAGDDLRLYTGSAGVTFVF